MLHTVTTCQTQTETLTLPPEKKLPLKKPDVNTIFEKILNLELFSEETIRDIKECLQSFNVATTTEVRLDILCFLLFHAVNPALCNANENDEERLLLLDDAIREEIAALLPSETIVDHWIEDWNETQLVVEKLEQITNLFESRMQRLQEIANASNQQIAKAFENLKQRIITIIQHKQQTNQHVANEVNELFENLDTLVEETNKLIISSNANSENFLSAQQVTRTLCKEALDKL